MIGRLRDIAGRPVSELPAGLVLAACVLVIALGAVGVAQIADPQPARESRPVPRADGAQPGGYEVTNPPVVSHEAHPSELPSAEGPSRARITAHDGYDVRTSTRWFLRGYLAYTYGRGAAIDITNVTRELIDTLTEHPPRVPDRIRRRHPRIELVQLVRSGATDAAAVAVINDGVTRYTVHLRLIRTGMQEWSVTDLEPA